MSWDNDYWNECYRDSSRYNPQDSDGWLDACAFEAGSAVLDLGCGAGTNIPALLACGAQLTAADLSAEAVRLVSKAFEGQLAGADCFDMKEGFPYPDGSFDAVVADLSLHYFTWEDTVRIIAGLRRILKNGGRLIARVHSMANLPVDAEPIAPGYYRAYGCDRRYFTMEDIQDLFAAWRLDSAGEKNAYRYGGVKKVIEFTAVKK